MFRDKFQISRVEARWPHCGVMFLVEFQVSGLRLEGLTVVFCSGLSSRFPGFRVEVRGAPQLPRPGHCWAPALYIVVDHFYSFQKKQLLTWTFENVIIVVNYDIFEKHVWWSHSWSGGAVQVCSQQSISPIPPLTVANTYKTFHFLLHN